MGNRYLLGYQLDDWDITTRRKKDFKITRFHREAIRRTHGMQHVMAGTLPFHVVGMCLPIPDTKDLVNSLFGIFKRVACEPPAYTYPKGRRHFKRFVRRFIHKSGLKPLSPSDVPRTEEWLEKTSYNEHRKQQIRAARDELYRQGAREVSDVESHNKWEFYSEYKPNRFINARVDGAKAYIGPIFWAIGDKVNHWKWFVKHIPFLDRPKALAKVLYKQGATYFITDYTSFESQWTRDAMHMIEFEVYKYMIKDLQGKEYYMDFFDNVLAGKFKMRYQFFNMEILSTRMSGEMNTSLGNGIGNLMLFMYAVHLNDPKADVFGFVEGDDGIFRVEPPSAAPTKQQLASLGFNLKIEQTKDFAEASFCGNVFDPEVMHVLADPIKMILKLGWCSPKHMRFNRAKKLQLLKAKAQSYLYQYNGCPIIAPVCNKILAKLAHVNVSEKIVESMGWYKRKIVKTSLKRRINMEKIDYRSRLVVEKVFGISVNQQLDAERMILEQLESGIGPVRWNLEHKQYQ